MHLTLFSVVTFKSLWASTKFQESRAKRFWVRARTEKQCNRQVWNRISWSSTYALPLFRIWVTCWANLFEIYINLDALYVYWQNCKWVNFLWICYSKGHLLLNLHFNETHTNYSTLIFRLSDIPKTSTNTLVVLLPSLALLDYMWGFGVNLNFKVITIHVESIKDKTA